MELLSVAVQCYKRFKSETSLQTNGKLVALLGPNEAGKSSLLDAIAHLGHTEPPSAAELSRDVDPQKFAITGRFFLDEADLAAASLDAPCTLVVVKRASGQRRFSLDPPAPPRDVARRHGLSNALKQLAGDLDAADLLVRHDDDAILQLSNLAEKLEVDAENLTDAVKAELSRLLELADEALSDAGGYERLLEDWRDAIDREKAPTPNVKACSVLAARLPTFLAFDETARDLASSYSIASLREEMPPALANLAEVAGLDFPELFDAIDKGLNPKITTIERRASEALGRKFREAWKQSGVEVAIRIQSKVLEVQVVNANSEFTALAERSDGLRQFVALQMFATRSRADQPILLIDEADQRLHYDAQADLVQMLARQQLAPKVIYTTHSAGCLPEDLGNGVRTIVQNEDGSSEIVNRFWSRKGRGLTPLLFGLGAATLAFFPTRRAVVVEGPSDMLLLPTLFREAIGVESLGFQFVPGLSVNKGKEEPEALAVSPNVLHLVDGDAGGRRIRDRLVSAGVPTDRIFVLRNSAGSALELEDFVAEAHLLTAINGIIAKWHPGRPRIESLRTSGGTRMNALEHAFQEATGKDLQKVNLAYGLLDVVSGDPTARLLDARRREPVEVLARAMSERFGLTAVASG